jgi:cellulose binding protein with CBM3 domain/fibronectin type III domain protein
VRTRLLPLAAATLLAATGAFVAMPPAAAAGGPALFANPTRSLVDSQPPTAPGQPEVTGVTESSVSLRWAPSTDDVGVTGYDVWAQYTDYVYKAATSTGPSVTVTGLNPASEYRFTVRARDAAGRESPPSPALTVVTAQRPGGSPFVAQYLNLDWAPGDGQIRPGLRLTNTTSTPIALSRLKLRYWFTRDAGAPAFQSWCDSASVGCTAVTRRVVPLSTPRPGADAYLEVGFTTAAGTLRGSSVTGPVQLRVAKYDQTAFTETNDYSWAPNAPSYANTTKVTVYLDGVRVGGNEP